MEELAAAHAQEAAAAAEQQERADGAQSQLTAALDEATAAVQRAADTEAQVGDKAARLARLEGASLNHFSRSSVLHFCVRMKAIGGHPALWGCSCLAQNGSLREATHVCNLMLICKRSATQASWRRSRT